MNYIELYSDNSKNISNKFKLLVDTGAGVSLIKANKLTPETYFNKKDKIILHGLNPNNPVETIGSCELPLKINNVKFYVKFHILNQATNVPYDGLIGKDFLQANFAIIDYATKTIQFNPLPYPIKLYLDPPNNKVLLQARSQTFVELKVENPEISEGIIPNIKLNKGIYISKAIVKVKNNNKCLVSILNTRVTDQYIDKITVQLEKLPNEMIMFNIINNNESPTKINRNQILSQNLRLDHLNSEEQKSITNICHKFNDIFFLPNDQLSCTKTIEHGINTYNNTAPIYTKSYRYPEVHKQEVNNQINKMLKQKIIQPSTSPWSSPLWVVPKKLDASGERKWRIVIDYRKLNDVSIGDVFPIPNIEEILDQLGHSKYFSTLDLASGFHQIPMRVSDREKTAFTTPLGHYEFKRMPFGLKNAPATFQRLMNSVLSGLQGIECFVYLDDIVVYASSLEEHATKLIKIFERLRLNNLKLQPDKCEFLRREVSYLGHIISNEGVKPNPIKIQAIKSFPRPQCIKSIKSFLGLVGYYRKFIQNFAKIAKPLTLLLKKDTPFVWTDDQEKSFEKFKDILMTEPLLQYPDFSKEFILTTDASNVAIGSVLSQGIINKDLPIAYASRTLNNTEQNYNTTEKELLAIIWSVNHFRPYLYGRKFKIVTDHKPLTWLFNCKDPGSKLVRWRLKLSEYDYEIVYKPGKINSNADALSRPFANINIALENDNFENFIKFHYKTIEIPKINSIAMEKNKYSPCILFYSKDLDESNLLSQNLKDSYDMSKIQEINDLHSLIKLDNNTKITYLCIHKNFHFDKAEYKDIFYCLKNAKVELEKNENFNKIYIHDITINNLNIKKSMFCEMIYYIFKDSKIEPILLVQSKIQLNNKEEITQVLKENHDSKLAGHSGFIRTYNRIKEYYKWDNMKKDIKNYIKQCPSCQINKTNFSPTKVPMEITSTSNKPFEKLAIDIVGPLPLTVNGNRFIFTMQDDLTKYSYAVPIPNHEAQTIAIELSKFITLFGIPKSILSDQGTDFTSKLMKELTKLFQTKHVFSSPYHPQSNGALERSHLTLKDYLKHFINDKQNNWDEFITFAMFSYNSHVHKSTGLTPYETLFGYKPFLPNTITSEPKFNYCYDDYIINLKQKLNITQKTARENLINSKTKSKSYYDNKLKVHDFQINDLVIIQNKQVKVGLNKKLSPNFKGPYKIIKIFPNQTVLLKIKNKLIRYHANMLKPFVSGSK